MIVLKNYVICLKILQIQLIQKKLNLHIFEIKKIVKK